MKIIKIFLIASISLSSVQADTLQITSAKDNTLYETNNGSLSNGAGSYSFIGKTDTNELRRALFQFDVSSIPVGSVVNSVSVQFLISKTPPNASPATADLHLVTNNWGQGTSIAGGPGGSGAASTADDATWVHTFYNTQLWSTEGGDFNPSSSSTTNYGTSNQEIMFNSNNALIADVQIWVDTPETNFGWIMLGDEDNLKSARRLNTHEHTDGRPVLFIDYTPADPIFANGFEASESD